MYHNMYACKGRSLKMSKLLQHKNKSSNAVKQESLQQFKNNFEYIFNPIWKEMGGVAKMPPPLVFFFKCLPKEKRYDFTLL